MLASIKKNKLSKYFIIFLSLLLFTSCSWFTNNDDDEQISFEITGNLISNDALPIARTAVASLPGGVTLSYSVELFTDSACTNALSDVNVTFNDSHTTYSLTYIGSNSTDADYYIRAKAYSGTTIYLQSPVEKIENHNFVNKVFSKDLEMRPLSEGSGTVNLEITLETPGNFSSATISDTEHFDLIQTELSSGTIRIKQKNSSVTGSTTASGSYTLTVSFYKTATGVASPGLLVYQFTDVINVFDGLVTNTWLDNGNTPHLTTSGSGSSAVTSCVITDAMLEDFKATNYYVDRTATGAEIGNYCYPFHSLKTAVDYINAAGNDTTTYTIHAKYHSDANMDVLSDVTGGIEIKKNISFECYTSIPGSKDNIYSIRKSSGSDPIFLIKSGFTFTVDSNTIPRNTNYPILGTPGIFIDSAASNGVTVESGAKFIMKGGRLRNASAKAVELQTPEAGKQTLFEMYSGSIHGCSGAYSYGIYVNSGATFKLSGKPYITESTKNIYLAGGSKINIMGKLEDNAIIGISIPDTSVPTPAAPVTITDGYGFLEGGYNANQNPGKYFRSDNTAYGITNDYMITSPAGEAVISPSGGNLSAGKLIDDIKISINKTFVSKDSTSKSFEFTATKDVDGTPTTIEAGEGTGKISYEYALNYSGEIVPQESYYQTDTKKITFKNTLPAGNYTITLTATYSGQKYAAEFDVKIVQPAKLNDTLEILPSGTSGTGGTSAKYIYFGDFPKTVKASNVIIDETETKEQGGSTYYLGSDGSWYEKCRENPCESGYTYSDSTAIGSSQKYFKVEPIKWRVLTEDFNGSGKWLILAEDILTSNIPLYDNLSDRTIDGKKVYSNNYEHSKIRAYLNGISYIKVSTTNNDYVDKGFLQKAFNTELQSKIVTTLVKNDLDSANDIGGHCSISENYICNNTSDKIFLLSIKEASTPDYGFAGYLDNDEARRKVPTDYALANYYSLNASYKWWMLRSPLDTNYRSRYVNRNYILNDGARNVNTASGGVVPAMCIEPQ